MSEPSDSSLMDELDARIESAFEEAYPELDPDESQHMAKNFIQVVRGIIDIGERLGSGEPTHMDEANSIVYWCIANTALEDLLKSGWNAEKITPSGGRITEEEMSRLLNEFAARIGDWLIGMEVLKRDPELYDVFVSGAVALGADEYERNRGNLKY